MAGFAPVGAIASISGLQQFIAGLTAAGNAFGAFGAQANNINLPLAHAVTGFNEFNNAVKSTEKIVKTVGDAFGVVTAPVRGIGILLKEVGSESVDALEDIAGAAAVLGTTGAVGMAAFSTAVTGAIGASIATAARFQREVVDLGAITQELPGRISATTDAVRGMGRQFGIAVPEIQSAALELSRAGVPMEAVASGGLELALALEQLSKGEITAGASAQALGSIMQVFQRDFERSGNTSTESLTRIANAITGIGNETRATIPEVVSAFNKMGAAFATNRESVEDAAAAVGLLLSAGIRGEEAGTALSNFFNRLNGPANEATKIMQEFGISINDAQGNTRPFAAVLVDLIETFGPAAKGVGDIDEATANWALTEIFQTRVLRAANLAILQGTERYEELRAAIAQTDVLRQAGQQMEALTRQVGRLRNIVDLAAISFGLTFIPNIAAATKELVGFLAEGERAERVLGVLGKGALGVVTGSGATPGSPAQEAVNTEFGPEAAHSLAILTEQVQQALGAIGETAAAAGRLKDAFVGIAFPTGIDDLVQRLGQGFAQANAVVQGFLTFLGEIGRVAADALGTATRNVLDFGVQLVNAFARGLTGADVADIFRDVGQFASETANVIGSLALRTAEFFRAVLDNRESILGVFTTVIRAIGKATEAIIFLAQSTLIWLGLIERVGRGFDVLGRVARGEPLWMGQKPEGRKGEQLGDVLGGEGNSGLEAQAAALDTLGKALANSSTEALNFESAIGRGTSAWDEFLRTIQTGETTLERQEKSLKDLVTVLEEADGRSLREGGSFLGQDFVPQDAQDNLLEIVRLLDQVEAGLTTEAEDTILKQIEVEAEHARASVAAALAVVARARPAQAPRDPSGAGTVRDRGQERRDAEKRAEDLKRARERLAEASEDATKNVRAAFRSLDTALASIEQRFKDGLEGIAESFRDSFDDLVRSASRNAQRLQESFDTSRGREAITRNFQRAQEIEQIGFQQSIENESILRQFAAEDAEQIEARKDREIEQGATQHFDRLTRIRQVGIDNANQVFSRGQEDALKIITESNDKIIDALSETVEGDRLKRSRTSEDTGRERQRIRDLAKARTAEERQAIAERFAEETTLTSERRREDDRESATRKREDEQLAAVRRSQEMGVLAFRRTQEDAATLRRRTQEENDVEFRIELEKRFQITKDNIQDVARGRQRGGQITELGFSRRNQEAGRQFGQQQQDTFRTEITEPFQQEDLNKALKDNFDSLLEGLGKLLQSAERQLGRLERTTDRETEGALQTFFNTTEGIEARLVDLRSDLLRTAPEIAGEFTSAFVGAQSQIAAAAGEARGVVDAAIERMGGLKSVADTSLAGFLDNVRELRESGGEAGTGIEIRALLTTPQGDRIIELLERVVQNTGGGRRAGSGGGSGPVIGEVNITAPDAVEGIQELERIFESVGGNQ